MRSLTPLSEDEGVLMEMIEEEQAEEAKRKKRGTRKRRGSVSAPPTGEINTALELRKFEKNPETLAFLRNTLASNFIFQEVKGNDADALAHAFEQMNQPAGYVLMKQGDDGDNFYCLRGGTVDIFVTPKEGGVPMLVLTLEGSGFFGELALMYQCPRAATVVCRTPCVLEALDGTSFHTVLRRSGQNRRVTYHGFLREVPLLQALRSDEIGKLADVLVQSSFTDGQYIITQGDEDAQTFYILYEGSANAILDQEGLPSMRVKSYARGDYFGELALISNTPRAANVVADGACVCLSIDRASFVRLLGTHQEAVERMGSAAYSSVGEVVDKPPAAALSRQEAAPASSAPTVALESGHGVHGRRDSGSTPLLLQGADDPNDQGWTAGVRGPRGAGETADEGEEQRIRSGHDAGDTARESTEAPVLGGVPGPVAVSNTTTAEASRGEQREDGSEEQQKQRGGGCGCNIS